MQFGTQLAKKSVSKFTLSNLAFETAIELRKASKGISTNLPNLDKFKEELSIACGDGKESDSFNFFEPGYYEPFSKLYLANSGSTSNSLGAVRGYVLTNIENLENFDPNATGTQMLDQLADFCFSLHKVLVGSLSAENKVARNDSNRDKFTSAVFC